MSLAYIGIGSNLGDRKGHLSAALTGLAAIGTVIRGSSIYETAPVGGVEQGAFLNAVVAVETSCTPRGLLDALLEIEASRGRIRDIRWGPRTLDLDLLWYDGRRVDEPGLSVPHPEIRNRRFVLVPLVEADPSIADAEGPYARSLDAVADQTIVRVSGPVHPDGTRWLAGIHDAIDLTSEGDGWGFMCHRDWANSSGDTFGAYLAAVSLFGVRSVAPHMSPTSITHRFLHGVPAGSTGHMSVSLDRESDRSIDAVVTHTVGGILVGRSMVSAIVRVPDVVSGPPAPAVTGIESTSRIGDLVAGLGRRVGLSAMNWGPLENWDQPDLAGGTQPVLRLWSPNAGVGSNDPYLTAASMLMPIDAAMWPATMQDLGLLPDGPAVFTPTVEFSAVFADVASDDLFHLCEAGVEHRTASSMSGTVRIWGDDGGYRATGRSYNLVHATVDR